MSLPTTVDHFWLHLGFLRPLGRAASPRAPAAWSKPNSGLLEPDRPRITTALVMLKRQLPFFAPHQAGCWSCEKLTVGPLGYLHCFQESYS
jgi:hypothetical protein